MTFLCRDVDEDEPVKIVVPAQDPQLVPAGMVPLGPRTLNQLPTLPSSTSGLAAALGVVPGTGPVTYFIPVSPPASDVQSVASSGPASSVPLLPSAPQGPQPT